MPGDTVILYSEDSICDDDPENPLMDVDGAAAAHKTLITPEQLHAETPAGMPHHELLLKVGAIVMLIRNLDVSSGMVNGLRLRVMSISRNLVRAEAISGGINIRGKTVDLPRIHFEGDLEATIRMKRTQFPLKLAFAMTINKSQGLTLRKVLSIFLQITGWVHCVQIRWACICRGI
jgi:ATP-dependent DNA helicase PIF1